MIEHLYILDRGNLLHNLLDFFRIIERLEFSGQDTIWAHTCAVASHNKSVLWFRLIAIEPLPILRFKFQFWVKSSKMHLQSPILAQMCTCSWIFFQFCITKWGKFKFIPIFSQQLSWMRTRFIKDSRYLLRFARTADSLFFL